MTSQQSSRIVTACLIIVALTAIIGNVGSGKVPKPRLFIAGAVVFVILGLLSDFLPQIAGPLAVLITIGVVVNQGEGAFGALAKRLGA